MTVPSNISDLFIKAKEKHMQKTRFSSSGNFYITTSRLSQTQGSFADLELNFGIPFTTNFVNSPREPLKKHIRAFNKHIHNILLTIMAAENCKLYICSMIA